MIYGIDSADSLERRISARPEHLTRLQTLHEEGRLLLAGPLPAIDHEDPGLSGFAGSLIVAEFPDLASAEAWAQLDPYVKAGVYKNICIHPFKRVLP